MNTPKEIYNQMRELASKHCLVHGFVEIRPNDTGVLVFKNPSWESMSISLGYADENLVLAAFEEYECEIERKGDYCINVLLSYSPAQIGNYPPPNVEVPEYWEIQYIEYQPVDPPEE